MNDTYTHAHTYHTRFAHVLTQNVQPSQNKH